MNKKLAHPRLSVDIPIDLRRRLDKLPWGTIKPLVIAVLSDTLDVIEGPHGRAVLGAILCKQARAQDYSRSLQEGE